MEKKNHRNSNVSGLVTAVLAVMVLILLAGWFIQKENISKLENEYNQKKASLEVLKEETDRIQSERDTLALEKEELENIQETTNSLHQKYYQLASELEQKIQNGESNLKIAYLTFDDGPYLITPTFLDVLDEYDVLATFFERKRDWEMYEETYKRVLASGHTIGNHTASHNLKKTTDGYLYKSVDGFIDDMLECQQYFEEKLNYTTTIMRFPGGSSTARSKGLKDGIVEELRELGYGYVDWDAATGDGSGPGVPVDESITNVLSDTKNRKFLVVLMHDYSANTQKALPAIIEGLKEQGYIFLPLFYESVAVNK